MDSLGIGDVEYAVIVLTDGQQYASEYMYDYRSISVTFPVP